MHQQIESSSCGGGVIVVDKKKEIALHTRRYHFRSPRILHRNLRFIVLHMFRKRRLSHCSFEISNLNYIGIFQLLSALSDFLCFQSEKWH